MEEEEKKTQAEIEMEEKAERREQKKEKRMPQVGKDVFEIEKLKEKREQEGSQEG